MAPKQKQKAETDAPELSPMAALRAVSPAQEFDILVPGDSFEFSPDEDRRRVFVFHPLADQTLTRIVFEASSVSMLNSKNPMVALASQVVTTAATARRICEEAIDDWRGLRDQHDRVVPFRKELLASMSQTLLQAVGDHIFTFSQSLATELKKVPATTPDASTPAS